MGELTRTSLQEDAKMLAKSEIALLTVSVFGTLTAWLAGPAASFTRDADLRRAQYCL